MATERDALSLLEKARQLEHELAAARGRIGAVPATTPERRIQALELVAAGRRYLVPVQSVREVIPMVRPQHLVDAPAWIMGTASLGPATLSLVDAGLRLEGTPTEVSIDLKIVVTDTPHPLGLVVSEVGRVVDLDVGALATPGEDILCAPFLLGFSRDTDGDPVALLSVTMMGLHGNG
jgi:chemotaxis signal transduction protein